MLPQYQFQVDGRPAAPVREYWEEAAQDAINAGMAVWSGRGIKHDDQCEIALIGRKAK